MVRRGARRDTRHKKLGLPRLDGGKKSKQAYNRAYYLKVEKKRRKQ